VRYRVISFVPVHVDHHSVERTYPRHDTTVAVLQGQLLVSPSLYRSPHLVAALRLGLEDEAAGPVLPYRLGMPNRKRPGSQDAATARRILIDGLARDADIGEVVGEMAPLHPRNNTFPGEVFLHVAADALDWAGASRADPLPLEGIQERFLPECDFRGRQNSKVRFAVLAAAALRGGAEPDLLDEVVWWQTDDFWQYALYAAVAYIRAAADRCGVPVREVCQELAREVHVGPDLVVDPSGPDRGPR
jgi:hypothetical protein